MNKTSENLKKINNSILLKTSLLVEKNHQNNKIGDCIKKKDYFCGVNHKNKNYV